MQRIFSSLELPKNTLTKAIVVAHYKEDLSWLDLYLNQIDHIVYTKANNLATNNIPINKGNEASCYLRYIIDHYERLPDVIAFVHGHRTAYNMKSPDDMVMALRSIKWGLYDYMPLQTALKMTLIYRKNISKSDTAFSRVQTDFNHDMWTKLFQEALGPVPNFTQFYCCASFAVTREIILKHPKLFYENVYNYILSIREEIVGLTGGMLEGIWHIIFGQPHTTKSFTMCELFHCKNTSNSPLIDCLTEKC